MATPPSPTSQDQLDPDVINLAKAIRHVESGDNFDAKGGSGESGAYQFMPATWKQWAGQYINDPNAPLTRENQNKVAYYKLKDLKDQGYNPGQIASIWNSGSPDFQGKVGTNKYGVAYNTPKYVNNVYGAYQTIKSGKDVSTYKADTTDTSHALKPGEKGPQLDAQGNAIPLDQIEQPKTVGGFAQNVITSTVNTGKGLYQAVRHPIKTAEDMANIFQGLVVNLTAEPLKKATELVTGGKYTLDTSKNSLGTVKDAKGNYVKNTDLNAPSAKTAERLDQQRQTASAVVDFYKKRYGSAKAIENTVYNDPVGAAFDAASVLDLGAGVVGKIGDVSKIEELSKAASTISKISDTVNPLNIPGKVISKVVAKPLQSFLSKSADTEAIAAAERLGVELPPTALSKSGAVRKIIQTTGEGIGGGTLKKADEVARAGIETAAENLQKKITPENIVDNEVVGNQIKDGFAKFQDAFKKQKETIYNAVSAQGKFRVATVDTTVKALEDILEQSKKALGVADPSEIKFYQNVLDSIQGKEVQFDNLRAMRTEIGKMIAKSPRDFQLRRLYGTLSSDLDKTAEAVSPRFKQMMNDADAYYKQNINRIQSSLGGSITKSAPEKLVTNLVKKNNVTNLRLLKTIVGDKAFEFIGSSFLSDLVKNSMSVSKTGEQEFNLAKFQRNVAKFDQPTLQEILSPEQMQNLMEAKNAASDTQLVKDAVKRGAIKDRGTIPLLEIGSSAVTMHPLALLGTIMGTKALATFILNPIGRKFIQGLGLTSGETAELFRQSSAFLKQGAEASFQAGRASQQINPY